MKHITFTLRQVALPLIAVLFWFSGVKIAYALGDGQGIFTPMSATPTVDNVGPNGFWVNIRTIPLVIGGPLADCNVNYDTNPNRLSMISVIVPGPASAADLDSDGMFTFRVPIIGLSPSTTYTWTATIGLTYSPWSTTTTTAATAPVKYKSWLLSEFPASELLNKDLENPNADFNGDGTPNFLHYLMGHKPNSQVPETVRVSVSSAAVSATFRRRRNLATGTLQLVGSGDLVNWQIYSALNESVLQVSPDAEDVTVQFAQPGAPTFFRLTGTE